MANSQVLETLSAAACELQGPLIRTSLSVIGQRDGERTICAATSRGFTVSVMLMQLPLAFAARLRGWRHKELEIAGSPTELAHEVIDEAHAARIVLLAPLLIELNPTGLRVEQRFGGDVGATLCLAVSLALRSRAVVHPRYRRARVA